MYRRRSSAPPRQVCSDCQVGCMSVRGSAREVAHEFSCSVQRSVLQMRVDVLCCKLLCECVHRCHQCLCHTRLPVQHMTTTVDSIAGSALAKTSLALGEQVWQNHVIRMATSVVFLYRLAQGRPNIHISCKFRLTCATLVAT